MYDFNDISMSRCRCSKCEAIFGLIKLHLQLLQLFFVVVFQACNRHTKQKKVVPIFNSRSVKEFLSYRSCLVKWLTLENSEHASYEAKRSLSLWSSMRFEIIEVVLRVSIIYSFIINLLIYLHSPFFYLVCNLLFVVVFLNLIWHVVIRSLGM